MPDHFELSAAGEVLVRINNDGTFEYGANYKPDRAARAFWAAVMAAHPSHMAQQARIIAQLQKENARLRQDVMRLLRMDQEVTQRVQEIIDGAQK